MTTGSVDLSAKIREFVNKQREERANERPVKFFSPKPGQLLGKTDPAKPEEKAEEKPPAPEQKEEVAAQETAEETPKEEVRALAVEAIIEKASELTGFSKSDILDNPARGRKLARARQVAAYVLALHYIELRDRAQAAIGKALQCDRTTARHGIKTIHRFRQYGVKNDDDRKALEWLSELAAHSNLALPDPTGDPPTITTTR